MRTYRFSIIVPVYNVAPYLERCVRSLANQDYEAYEIILVDDGSTDGSENMCETYAGADDRIKVFHKNNGGLSSARNYGIKNAAGEYLLFVDSDDYVANNMCSTLEEGLQQYGKTDLVSFDAWKECGEVRENVRRIPQDYTVISGGRNISFGAINTEM